MTDFTTPSQAAPGRTTPTGQPRQAGKGLGRKFATVGLGASISAVALGLLYGFESLVQLVLLAVICTAGFGLIPILFVSFVVGWVALATWGAIRERARPDSFA